MSSRDSRFRKLAKSGSVLLAGLVFQLGLSFLAQLLIARHLGKVSFGAVALGASLLTSLAVVSLLGLNTGMARYLPRYEEPAARRGVLRSAFQAALLVAVTLGVAVFLASGFLADRLFGDPALGPVFRIFAVALPFAVFVNLTIGATQGLKFSLPKVAISNVLQPSSRFALVAVVAAFGYGVIGGALAYAIPHVLAAAVAGYVLYRYVSEFSIGQWEPKYRELLSFSLPLSISMIMSKVLSSIDIFLLGALATTGDVGVYSAVYPVARLLQAPISAFTFLFLPLLSELHANGERDEMRRMYLISTKWIVMASLPVFLVIFLFPGVVVNLTFGNEYVEGAATLSILAVGFFVPVVAGLNHGALTSIGRTRVVMYADTAAAVLNVALNLVLIPRYTYLGAGVATAVSFLLLHVIYSTVLYRETGIQPFSQALVRPMAISVALVAVLYAGARAFLPLTPPVLAAVFAVFLASYAVIIVRFGGIEEEEVMLIVSFEERFDVDLGPVKDVANWFMG